MTFVVRFEPSGLRCHCSEEVTLLQAGQKAGVSLPAVCGGAGTCGKCRVFVKGAVTPPTAIEREVLSERELRDGMRLACQTRPLGEVVVTPVETEERGQILSHGVGRTVRVEPAVEKRWIRLEAPTLESNPFDWEDLRTAVGEAVEPNTHTLWWLRELPRRLRRYAFAGTCVMVDRVLVDFERGDTTRKSYGLAVDLGTTTVVAKLVDLRDGTVEAVSSAVNPQRVYGEDVVSRIQHAARSASARRELQKTALRAIDSLLGEVLSESGVRRQNVYEAVVVGNTAMLHLLLGADAEFLAQYPYVPAFRGPVRLPARELGLRIHPRGQLYLLPAIGRFVGADTTGVLLATDLLRSEAQILAVDIGTNGEIVLGDRRGAIACSTAAGPAFEGANITHGMRAERGAIDTVWLDGDELRFHVIGEGEPRGLCGSAAIDLVALLLSLGVVDETGRMRRPDELPGGLPADVRSRVQERDGVLQFLLAEANGRWIGFTQRDVREIQLAKGAIATGIDLLLREAGISIADVGSVVVAGGFGNYIRPENAVRIGLLPPVDPERIRFVGNAALTGAEMALLSTRARQEAEWISQQVRYVEIAAKPEFQERFAENMLFPSAEEMPEVWRPRG